MRYTIATIIVLTALSSMAGCGQTGPLYLPGHEPDNPPEDSTKEKPAKAEPQSETAEQAPSEP